MALQNIIQGYKNFQKDYFNKQKDLFEQLSIDGQKPQTLVIACSDSRVDPAIVTNAKPGDLFVVRNVANLVPPYENDHTSYHGVSSALEFAVCFLEVKHIIVFGHSNCGGLSWLFNDSNHQETSFIDKWMELASSAVKKVKDEGAELAFDKKLELCCKYSLLNSINNLKTFPWISTKLIKKEISLHAWYFDISTGSIMCVDQENKFSHL